MARFAVEGRDIVAVAERLGRAAGLPFERRDSDHWGPYCLIRLSANGSGIRVLENVDPVYRPELDPPEDAFFEADFPGEQILVQIDVLEAALIDWWSRLIAEVFPGAVAIRRRVGES